jgi:hypothetical protein
VRQVSRGTRIASSIVAVTCAIAAYGGVATNSASASTRSARGATDPSADKTARAATVTLEDLGAGWTQYRKAGGFSKGDAKSCGYRFGSPLKRSDHGYAGPMFRDATKTVFAYSDALVFRNEAAAKAYTLSRTSPAYLQCQAAQDDAAQKKADPKTFVRMAVTTIPEVGVPGGPESFYEEEAGSKNADGTDGVNAAYYRLAYRHGRVVYVLKMDTAAAKDEASVPALGDRLTATSTAMNTAIEARLTALGA